MKRTLLMLLATMLLIGLTACAKRGAIVGTCNSSPETCGPVASDPCSGAGRGRGGAEADPTPPGGVVTYPYYSLRGPRDFLAPNPRSIGP
jgi:hypothetical protein